MRFYYNMCGVNREGWITSEDALSVRTKKTEYYIFYCERKEEIPAVMEDKQIEGMSKSSGWLLPVQKALVLSRPSGWLLSA